MFHERGLEATLIEFNFCRDVYIIIININIGIVTGTWRALYQKEQVR